jgi:hypothetical protein
MTFKTVSQIETEILIQKSPLLYSNNLNVISNTLSDRNRDFPFKRVPFVIPII